MPPFPAVARPASLAAPVMALLLASGVFAQGTTPVTPDDYGPMFRRHQLVGGVGHGPTFEKDIFNAGHVGHGYAAKTDPATRIAYHYNLDAHWSVGVVMHGYTHEFPGKSSSSGDLTSADFELETSNRGVIVQHYFARGKWQPYAYGMLTHARGSVKASVTGNSDKLGYEGLSFGGGAGVLGILSRYIGISVDAGLSLGKAEWDETPFSVSDGDSFSPSYGAVTINLVLLVP